MSPNFLDGVLWSLLMVLAWFASPEVFAVFLFTLAVLAIALVGRWYLAHRDLQRKYADACDARDAALREVGHMARSGRARRGVVRLG